MADINLAVPANHKISPATLTTQQHTFVADEAFDAGAPFYIKANGNIANTNTGAAATGLAWGITLRRCAAGEGVTGIRRGPVEGFDLTNVAYGAKVYTSATVGRLADATSANAGVVGTVMPVYGVAPGVAPDKVLLVECNASGT